MSYHELLSRPVSPPDRVIRYGEHPDQIIDVRDGTGGPDAPVVVLLHGGFWRAEYDRLHTRPMADGLAAQGYTVCSPEYRRIGTEGGGYPGTFDDAVAAIDAILAAPPTTGGVVLVGHSAGGHLALWTALRHRLPPTSPWYGRPGIRGVVGLAAVSDVGTTIDEGLGDGAGTALLGGRFDLLGQTDPLRMVTPDDLRLVLVHGVKDRVIPVSMSRTFAGRATSAELVELEDVGHFKLVDPLSRAWQPVLDAISSVVGSGTDVGSDTVVRSSSSSDSSDGQGEGDGSDPDVRAGVGSGAAVVRQWAQQWVRQ
ncbi:alpha/beta hydrolase [Streptosporangium sp. KLBMP 9127]|nr:alpha/beta hydrolase [Streptosporangium sp. KLBMP 9127]